MGRAIVLLHPVRLAEFLKGNPLPIVDNPLPPDARIVDVRMTFGGCDLELVVESESYGEIPPFLGSKVAAVLSPKFARPESRPHLAGWQKGKPAMEAND